MVSSSLRCLVRFIVCGQRCLQVVLYILAVFCFKIGSSFDVGVRPNYLLDQAERCETQPTSVQGKPQRNGSVQE